MRKISLIAVAAIFLIVACNEEKPEIERQLPRYIDSFVLLDQMPDEATLMPNGTTRFVIKEDNVVTTLTGFAGKIFNIHQRIGYETSEDLQLAKDKIREQFGEPVNHTGSFYQFKDKKTRVNVHFTRGRFTITMSDIDLTRKALGRNSTDQQ